MIPRRLTLRAEIVRDLTNAAGTLDMSRGPKEITWQCHVSPPKKSFACTIH
jgi:hypothetical protein